MKTKTLSNAAALKTTSHAPAQEPPEGHRQAEAELDFARHRCAVSEQFFAWPSRRVAAPVLRKIAATWLATVRVDVPRATAIRWPSRPLGVISTFGESFRPANRPGVWK